MLLDGEAARAAEERIHDLYHVPADRSNDLVAPKKRQRRHTK